MKTGTVIEFFLEGPVYGTALIAQDESVWIAINPKWWDLASWVWWWFCPRSRSARVLIRSRDSSGGIVNVRSKAICVARNYARVNGMPQLERGRS
jgi:hypothetical protein